jgi:hypothetical protein
MTMRQRAEMRRSTRLWLEVTRPRRFSRFNQQPGVERECLAWRGRRQRHSGGPAASWQDWPRTISAAFGSRHGALPHHSRADDAQRDKMEIKIAFWALVLFAAFMAAGSLSAYFQKK